MLKINRLPNEPGWGMEPPGDWGKINTTFNGLHLEGKIETIPGNYSHFYTNLSKAIRDGEPLMVLPEEALMTIRILETCLLSNRERKTIDFN
jgi:predicted dehydrogenase